ncbi:putative DNA breaking-rejoining enzymes [Magnetospirillum gryphiswaldense MSR-1 v2]|uniref:DNA breaking-rejoining enzymes n=1 Tax=Magnetospirillum gryphiswaldense (strain DSM 6361 / JCM 21280 / NBRC 15271 / MSR-1) TaxID=431944 RepID=V6F3X6_MAGGM|nr:tyrosine-type recombinase/integrase [Magnetospirillum gryphiswaldense]CDL00154.1 putative DNA breaking-rejoining enzymes [Magnetospirillum gryphiswaldense MSR-1 v2]
MCQDLDDEPRWLIGLISDSGMRLAEAAGLTKDDVVLNDKFPHINLRPHPWRQLKTQSSARIVPLVGVSLWAAQRAVAVSTNAFLFPKYCDEQECKANSASAALNKWMSPRVPKGCVVHSFRHSLRDRLRAIECPRDIVDRLGGWTVDGIGEAYGNGYPIHVLHKWMEAIA